MQPQQHQMQPQQHQMQPPPPQHLQQQYVSVQQPHQLAPQYAKQPVPAIQTMQPNFSPPSSMDDGPKQLIVNFLDPEVTNAELHAAFSTIGALDAARVIYDKLTSRSKGYGFVYFKQSRDAAAAMQCMTGHPMRGRRIKVSYANPQRPLPAEGAGGY
jgi:RNA recognition motif-containing protein